MESKTLIILGISFLILFSMLILGDGSIAKLQSIKESVALQGQQNIELQKKINELKDKTHKLNKHNRYLEKTVRNEHGLAKAGELIFIFDD